MEQSSNSSNQSESSQDDGSDMQILTSMMQQGISARALLSHLAPSFQIPAHASERVMWNIILSMLEPPKRKKLVQYNTIEDATQLIRDSKNILVLSGAGISTSAGIPDFRSRNGIYVQIHSQHPDLSDPKSMFDIEYFRRNPLPFYQFAKTLYPGQFAPTIGHKFIHCIENHGKLLRNYTQNIDTLERQANITKVVECHGSFAKATCTSCKYVVDGDVIRDEIFTKTVPLCPKCRLLPDGPQDGLGVMKPNIVFFGEQLGEEFHHSIEVDKERVDLLIVIGSSLKVRPVALIPRSIPSSVPQILINKEPLSHLQFDIELLGNCDNIIQELCQRLGDKWLDICEIEPKPMKRITDLSQIESLIQPINDSKNIEESDKPEDDNEDQKKTVDENEDDDWEDLEVIDSADSSSDSLQCSSNLSIPGDSFVFIKPNIHLFEGAELTKAQLDRYLAG